MTQEQRANARLMGGGGKSWTFPNVGDQVWGTVLSIEEMQQREFGSNALKTFKGGEPMMQLVIAVQTDDNDGTHDEDGSEDDGIRRIYTRRAMESAIKRACLKVGAREGVLPGGKLLVRYTAEAPVASEGMSPEKLFFAKYEPPAAAQGGHDDDDPGPDPDDLPF